MLIKISIIIYKGEPFMKRIRNIIAAASAAALCISPSANAYAAVSPDIAADNAVYEDASVIISYNENAPHFATVDEAAAYVKQQFKERKEEFDLIVDGWVPDNEDDDDINNTINERISTITDDPTEGMYLYLTASISSGSIYRSDGTYVYYSMEYLTTPEQEDMVTAEVAKLKDTPGFEAAMKSDVYDKILWAYDTVVENIRLDENLNDLTRSTAYSALIEKKANESGQMHVMVRLLQEVGVQPMIYATNLSALTNDNVDCHFLCLAQIGDVFYFVDPIWEYKMGENKHRFFLKGYSDLDSENEGKEEFTHVHLFELFQLPIDEIMAESNFARTKYIRSCNDGDVNDDGEINAVDASLMLKEYAKLSSSEQKGSFSEAQKKAADIDGNGFIDAVDASATLAYYAYVSTLENDAAPESIKEHSRK